jgi:hypothetical protein
MAILTDDECRPVTATPAAGVRTDACATPATFQISTSS